MLYKDSSKPIEDRVKDLLSRMNLKEKIGQLNQVFCGWNSYQIKDGEIILTDDFKQALEEGMAGAVYGMHRSKVIENGKTRSVAPDEGVRVINYFQEKAMEYSKWGIPLLISEECPKGFNAPGATTFSSPIAYSSSWNTELLREIGRVSAKEIRAGGGTIGYSPILDIAQDPRWSRIEEVFGEDPYLAGKLGAAMVEGMQGDTFNSDETVISTLKHFAAYGSSEGGRNTAPSHMGERELREIHLLPFEMAIKAGAQSVMCAYNEIDGVPTAANRWLLTEVLRNEWGFEGFVVSDALAIDELCVGNAQNIKHRVAKTLYEAASLALKAGVDISLWDKAYLYLQEAVDNNLLTEDVIDTAVARILRIKFMAGLFEKPFGDEKRALSVMGCKEHRDLALEASRQSIVLLKNQGILPLDKSKKLAVVGPNAHNLANMLGTYTPSSGDIKGTTIFEGMKQLSENPDNVRFALGCRIKEEDRSGFAEAIEIAKDSDVIVVAVGGSSAQDKTIMLNENGQIDLDTVNFVNDIDNGENVDRADLNLAGVQNELLAELKKLNKPMVVVLVQGRPYEINWIAENADAILCAWYPGQDGGRAVAEIIYGDVNPSGKLTISFPKTLGQIPVYYNHKPSAEKSYMFIDTKPLYSFGYGLSYTEFKYSNLNVETLDRSVKISVDVKNIGERDGEEIVQLYIRDEYSTVTRPIKELKGFDKISLKPGETKTVEFTLSEDDLSFWGLDMKKVFESGEFTVFVGGNLEKTLKSSFTL